MAISKDLFLALISMDAYNRGYGAGVEGLADAKDTLLGNASILDTSAILLDASGQRLDQAAGFYAVAYRTTQNIGSAETGGVIPAGTHAPPRHPLPEGEGRSAGSG